MEGLAPGDRGRVFDAFFNLRPVVEGEEEGHIAPTDAIEQGAELTKEALRIMKKHAVRRLPVISHQRRLIGTVWLDDVKHETRTR